ncbi:hypothetical protein [Melaminivora sp.]|uniref:hypothetical protein n=1 Tax=Melaminivora sp. TaxID=1933032 RepID=UPI0028AECDAF|nr:hypothetical protein [Melaminivora sp.]
MSPSKPPGRVRGAVAACAALVLAGCASAPVPLLTGFETTLQRGTRSAGHWELLSREVAAQTRSTLQQIGYGQEVPVHVSFAPQPSAFDLAWRDFLITALVQQGAIVQQAAGAPLELTYHTQLVHHRSAPELSEVILTTTVSRGGQYLTRASGVYYLENADASLFLHPAPQYRAVPMRVVSQ